MIKVYGITAFAILLAAGTAQSFAAPATAAAPSSASVGFIDLTKPQGGASLPVPSTVPAPAAATNSAPRVVDLTNGSATPMAEREWPASRVARVHAVDLTNGAAPPDLNTLVDD